MNFILLIIIIGFLELEARGVNNHPAHGPGPPPLIGDIYSIDNSHESHQPAESPTLVLNQQQQIIDQVQSSSMANNENNFNDIFSSTSSENIEYTDNDNDKPNSENYNNHDLIADDNMNNQKLIIDNRNRNRNEQLKQITDDEYALNALKEITTPIKMTMLQAQSNLASLDTTTSGTNTDNNHDKSTLSVNSKINNEKFGNCGTFNIKNKIDNYLKLGDQVIQVKLSESNDHTLPSITTAKATVDDITLHFDVTHDVFQTHKGLLAGFVYKGE